MFSLIKKKTNKAIQIVVFSLVIASLLFLSVRVDLFNFSKTKAAGSFSLHLYPSSVTIGTASTINLAIALHAENGFSGNVRVSISKPGNVDMEISSINDHLANWSSNNPEAIDISLGTGNGQNEWNFIAPTFTPNGYGSHTISVTASGGGHSTSGSISFSQAENPSGDYVWANVDGNKKEVSAGSSVNYGISIDTNYTGQTTFSSNIITSVSGLSCGYSSSTIDISPGGGSTNLGCSTSSSTPNGYYMASIQNSQPGGNPDQQFGVRLKVNNSSGSTPTPTATTTTSSDSGDTGGNTGGSGSSGSSSSTNSNPNASINKVSNAATKASLVDNISTANIILSSSSSKIGEKIKISGSKFTPDTELTIWWDPYSFGDKKQGGKINLGQIKTDNKGEFKDKEIALPTDWTAFIGKHVIFATNGKIGDGESSGVAELEIISDEAKDDQAKQQKITDVRAESFIGEKNKISSTQNITLQLADALAKDGIDPLTQKESDENKKTTEVSVETFVGGQACNSSNNLSQYFPENLKLLTKAYAASYDACSIAPLKPGQDHTEAAILGSLSSIDQYLKDAESASSVIKLSAAIVMIDKLKILTASNLLIKKIPTFKTELEKLGKNAEDLKSKFTSKDPSSMETLPNFVELKVQLEKENCKELTGKDREEYLKKNNMPDKVTIDTMEGDKIVQKEIETQICIDTSNAQKGSEEFGSKELFQESTLETIYLLIPNGDKLLISNKLESIEENIKSFSKVIDSKINLEEIKGDIVNFDENKINDIAKNTMSILNYLQNTISTFYSGKYQDKAEISTTQKFGSNIGKIAGIEVNWQGSQWKYLTSEEKDTQKKLKEKCYPLIPYILGQSLPSSFRPLTDEEVAIFIENDNYWKAQDWAWDVFKNGSSGEYFGMKIAYQSKETDVAIITNKIKQLEENNPTTKLDENADEYKMLKELKEEIDKFKKKSLKELTEQWFTQQNTDLDNLMKKYEKPDSDSISTGIIIPQGEKEKNERLKMLKEQLEELCKSADQLKKDQNKRIISWVEEQYSKWFLQNIKKTKKDILQCQKDLENDPMIKSLIQQVTEKKIKVEDIISWSKEGMPLGAITVSDASSTSSILGKTVLASDNELVVTTNYLMIETDSPVALLVTDPLDRLVGWDPVSQGIINQVDSSIYSGINAGKNQLFIPNIYNGKYIVRIMGLEDTDYKVNVKLAIADQLVQKEFSGKVKKNEFVDGEISTKMDIKSTKLQNWFSDFWQDPIKWIPTFIGAILIIGFGIYFFRKYYLRKHQSRPENIM